LFTEQISTVHTKLETLLESKLAAFDTQLDALSKRFGVLERDFSTERDRYLREMSEKNAELAKELLTVQNLLRTEQANRQAVESGLIQRLTTLDIRLDSLLQKERVSLDQKLTVLRESLVDYKRTRDLGDEKFQAFVVEELATLKNSVTTETQTRESSDEDIITALNHYTRALQDALRIVNS